MADMEKRRERVIEMLNDLHAVACGLDDRQCYVNGMGISRLRALIDEATAVIREGTPESRVMTLEEIPYAVFGWMELRMFDQIIPCVLEDVYADDTVGFANVEDGHDYMCASDYGKTWRCWTSSPTDAQREAEPWE